MILIFMHHTGIYTSYWCLSIILKFTFDTGIYVRHSYLHACDTGILHTVRCCMTFKHNAGIFIP